MNWLTHRSMPLVIGLILSLGATGLGFAVGTDHMEGAQLAARWTSRVGVPVFLTAYLASSLVRLLKNRITIALMQTRRQWGLAFAWTHSVHLIALTYFLTIAGTPPDEITVLGGGLAYFMIYVMALTSNDWSMRRLGKNWMHLHRFGIHYIWFIYLFTYAGRLRDPDLQHVGIIGAGFFLAALALRWAAKWYKPSKSRETLVQ